jgi:UPF0755 protein
MQRTARGHGHAGGAARTGALGALAFLALVLVAAAWGGWRWLGAQLDRPGPAAVALRLQVAPGSRLRGVLGLLQRQGALQHALAVEVFLRLQGHLPRIQAGLYEITPHESARQIVTQLAEGRVLLSAVTIVEGWTFGQMRAALNADADVQHDTRALSDAQVMQLLGHAGEPAEGRFFPDTYPRDGLRPHAGDAASRLGTARRRSAAGHTRAGAHARLHDREGDRPRG